MKLPVHLSISARLRCSSLPLLAFYAADGDTTEIKGRRGKKDEKKDDDKDGKKKKAPQEGQGRRQKGG